MVNFFRKIRKHIATDKGPASQTDRFFKYSRYAIGEIFLVVIGILIALQINTWNEGRKERKTERDILSEIKENLAFDLIDLENNITNFKNKATSAKSLLSILQQDIEYHDSIGYFFSYIKAYPHLTSKTNGYNLLKTTGMGIIQNDSIRKEISDLYEDRYPYILTYEKERISYNMNVLHEAMNPYFGTRALTKELKPASIQAIGNVNTLIEYGFFRNIRNYEALKKDQNLLGIIKGIEMWAKVNTNTQSQVKEQVRALIAQIEEELAKK